MNVDHPLWETAHCLQVNNARSSWQTWPYAWAHGENELSTAVPRKNTHRTLRMKETGHFLKLLTPSCFLESSYFAYCRLLIKNTLLQC